MELPYGISGFYNSDEPKPPEMDVIAYKKMCYEIAKKLGGELRDFKDSLYPANFYKAYFKLPANSICLVMNKHYPLLAFTNTVEVGEAMKFQFLNFPEGKKEVPREYTVLSAETLESEVPENIEELRDHSLNKGDLEQIKYWKPETIGQIIFNFWD